MNEQSGEHRSEVRTCAIGYGSALLLTAAAFGAVYWRLFGVATTLYIVLALGLAQMMVHFRFFLHISFAKSARTDLALILFSTLIIALMVSGTFVLIFNWRARMMN